MKSLIIPVRIIGVLLLITCSIAISSLIPIIRTTTNVGMPNGLIWRFVIIIFTGYYGYRLSGLEQILFPNKKINVGGDSIILLR